MFHCHNCGSHKRAVSLLKDIDNSLYVEYIKEKFYDQKQPEADDSQFIKPEPFQKKDFVTRGLKKISTMTPDSRYKQYVMNRHIPVEHHYKLFVVEKFKTWVNEMLPGKFEDKDLGMDEPRLVIPFTDEVGRVFGFQGRSFAAKSKLRYISIMLDEEMPKIFGLDKLDKTKKIRVVEGPIDSMFLKNGIASAGGSITSNLMSISKNKKDFVIIYDNEPRSLETVKKIGKAIDAGFPVCIWPTGVDSKDINQMILDGWTRDEIESIIDNSTYEGLMAKVKFQQWKKI